MMRKIIYTVSMVSLLIMWSCGGGKKTTAVKSNTETTSKDTQIKNKYANLLNTSKDEITNVKLYSFIDDWYGTTYKYGGMAKTGVDCSGFCNVLYGQVYKQQIDRTTRDLSKKINKVNKTSLKEGDLVFFTISGKKNSHVGIYLKNNMFVHASSSKGVVISSLENPYYKKNYSTGGGL